MVKIREAIVVEGRYDKNTLSQIVDAAIFQTNGFSIRKDKALLEMLRRVAQTRGLVVMTDSDGAGFMIRNFIKSGIAPEYLKHAYIPDIPGKERRKTAPGKEGKLGVEGMTPEIILDSLRKAGVTFEDEIESEPRRGITKQDMFDLGLSGGPDSRQKRLRLLKYLNMPEHMSANAMLQALDLLLTKAELTDLVQQMEMEHD